MTRDFRAGEKALLLDRKGRRYLGTLAAGGEFHTHAGPVAHDDLIGQPEGTTLRST
ncbi:MAG TPA: SAM-dependent methyltransferase, partial [Actinomycetota bacterium]|nr:SAM-dependent methyltransferase [Actinomycetota bacterium]